jgi:Flp pilus assembly pilin Flp
MLPVDNLLALWREDEVQDIAEYATMLSVIVVIIIATIRLIGSNFENVFSSIRVRFHGPLSGRNKCIVAGIWTCYSMSVWLFAT